jgi:hypothetical protein
MIPEQEPAGWQLNYFNYFTEVEERFQRARGTSLFLLSPLDWALIESWKNAGIPLEAVLRGIDVAFEKWREKRQRGREVNSLAWCAQAVTEEAGRMQEGIASKGTPQAEAPFTVEELRGHLARCAADVRAGGLGATADALEDLAAHAAGHISRLEELEAVLTGMEDRMIAVARAGQSDEEAAQIRSQLGQQLRPYRGKMTAPQIAMLEKQYLDRMALERRRLPRLSLFYLR